MDRPPEPARRIEKTLLIVAFALLLFASPILYLWAQDDSPWYLPYLLWLTVIACTAWVQSDRPRS